MLMQGSMQLKMGLLIVVLFHQVLASTAAASIGHLLLPAAVRSPDNAPPLCPAVPLPSAIPAHLLSKLQPFLDEAAKNISAALEADKSPGGVVINMVYNDTVLWTKGFGLINDSEPSRGAPDGDTAFRIGSITKVFTALMMLMLRDAGTLPSIDQDISHYLPEFKIQNPFQTKRGITFRQLSSHMAGLPKETPCPNIFISGCNLTYDEIYKNLAKESLMFPPGSYPSYSNLGFAVLGRTLEKIRGPTWEQQIQEMALDPLHMTHTGNSFTPDVMKYLAVGYSPNGTVANLINAGYEAPAGQMFSTTNDLAQLMMMLFRPELAVNPDIGQLLDGVTIREWMHPAYMYADGTGYGHPWELIPFGNYTLRTKSGDIPGYASAFQMAPEIKTGTTFLQSCEFCASYGTIVEVSMRIISEVSRILWTMQPAPRLPPSPSDYVGIYVGRATQTLTAVVNITLGDVMGHKALLGVIEIAGITTELISQWIEGDKFQLTTQGMSVPCYVLAGGLTDEYIQFQRSGSEVVELTIPGLIYGVEFKKT